MRYSDAMSTTDDPRYAAIRDALATAEESSEPAEALPPLRAAADRLTDLIDDTMAQALVTGRTSLRSVGAGAGLSENAVGPRLARTPMLAPYANESGRDDTDQEPRPPMRFRPRRTT
jgi:hypothetical protein